MSPQRSAVKEQRMTGDEVIAEVEWLLDGGVHPLLIMQELDRSAVSIEGLARMRGNQHVQHIFQRIARQERFRR